MQRRWLTMAATTLMAVTCAPTVVAAAAADDQERLDAAMEAFNERMTTAGWESQGPPDDSDDDEDADAGDSAGDDAFTECLGQGALLIENLDADEFPGQVAASSSDEFIYAPNGDDTSTTEGFSLDFAEETAAAFSAAVDDANLATVTEYIDVMGAKDTGNCMRQALEAEMAVESEDSEAPVEFDIEVTNEADLGIGDRSAALGYEISAVFIVPITVDIEVVFAQAGNDVVGVVHAVTGEQASDFDPRAELQTIVDALTS